MVTIKSVLLFISFLSCLHAAQISLAVSGNNVECVDSQKRLYRVQAGNPFSCIIEMSQTRDRNPQITFKGGKGLTSLGVSNTYQSVNGKQSISYGYQFSAQKPGKYSLGPIEVIDGQIKYEVEALTIEAVNTPVGASPSRQVRAGRRGAYKQSAPVQQPPDTTRIEITVNNKEPYINEPVVLTVNHYFSDGVIDYQTVQPKAQGFAVKEIGAAVDTRDSLGARVIQKKYLLSPIGTGKKTIDPVEVHYLVQRARAPRQASGDIFEMFLSDFMDVRPEQKKGLSNELEINVKPLPSHKGKVDAVGAFTSFKASVDRAEVPVYETVKYILRLEGEGNLEQITTPKLVLPGEIKTYESKSELIQSLQQGSLEGERKFEFVLQPKKPGKIIIPSQKYTFFNYQKAAYQTLSTEPIEIEVTGTAQVQTSEAPLEDAQLKEDAAKVVERIKKQEDDSAQELVKYSQQKGSSLPWHYFIVLILVLPLILFWSTVRDFSTSLFVRNKKKITFTSAIERVKKMSDSDIFGGALYKVMVEVFSSHYGISDYYSSDIFKAKLMSSGFTFEEQDRFMHFIDNCASIPFSTTGHNQSTARALQQEALSWLERLTTKKSARGR